MDTTDPTALTVTGGATTEEVAAVLAVLLTLHDDEPATEPPASRWADRGATVRAPVTPGPGAWRHPHR